MRNRIVFSQNFLRSRKLVSDLIRMSSIDSNDTVIDIGAGQGIITEELSKVCKKVIAFELDQNLGRKLAERFRDNPNVTIKIEDFFNATIKEKGCKVFSNIPFAKTANIIKKLTTGDNTPNDSYLIVQEEAAERFAGKPYGDKNTLQSVLLYPWFEVTIVHKFDKQDFFPKPNVGVVLMQISKRTNSLVREKSSYEDFVSYTFSQFKPNVTEGLEKVIQSGKMFELANKYSFSSKCKPSELDFHAWIAIYNYYLDGVNNDRKRIVRGSYAKLQLQQQSIQKINRTRIDKNWSNIKPVRAR